MGNLETKRFTGDLLICSLLKFRIKVDNASRDDEVLNNRVLV